MLYPILYAVAIFSSLTLFDQITKIIAAAKTPSDVRVIKYILEFTYVENDGAAFGMLGGQKLLFFIITIIALFALGFFLTKIDFKKKKVFTSAIILLIAGTLGNAIDRISYGYVIDFIRFPFIDSMISVFKLPGFVCNIADIYLTFGIVLILVELLILEFIRRKKKKKKAGHSDNVILVKDEKDNEENNEQNK